YVPGDGARDDGRAPTDGASGPRRRRPGRFGLVVPRDPSPGRVLRCEVRCAWLHRLGSDRVSARAEPGVDHDGAARGGEHPAVLVVPYAVSRLSLVGAVDLRSGRPGRGGLLGGNSPAERCWWPAP